MHTQIDLCPLTDLKEEADGALAGFEQELLIAHAQHLALQSIPHRITHTQLMTYLVQCPVTTHTDQTHTHACTHGRTYTHARHMHIHIQKKDTDIELTT